MRKICRNDFGSLCPQARSQKDHNNNSWPVSLQVLANGGSLPTCCCEPPFATKVLGSTSDLSSASILRAGRFCCAHLLLAPLWLAIDNEPKREGRPEVFGEFVAKLELNSVRARDSQATCAWPVSEFDRSSCNYSPVLQKSRIVAGWLQFVARFAVRLSIAIKLEEEAAAGGGLDLIRLSAQAVPRPR